MTLKPAMRSLRRTPTVTVASVVTLALAIGVNTAMFSIVYGVLLRPLPLVDPGSLVQLNAVNEADRRPLNFSAPEFVDWQERPHVFSGVVLFAVNPFTVTGDGEAEAIRGAVVSEGFFQTLGVSALHGRVLRPDDGRAPTVVLSERFWRRRFGGAQDVAGATMVLNGQPYEIVGIMSDAFRFPADDVDVWTPLGYAATMAPPQWNMRGFRPFSLLGRLKPRVTLAQAREDAGATAKWLAQTYPRFNDRMGAEVEPLSDRLTGRMRPALLMLFGATGLVLLIACANLASLAVVRTAGRGREIAVRTAIGAGRLQLLQQFLVESALIAVAGGTLGLIVATWSLNIVKRLAPADVPRLSEIRMDTPVLLFALAITTLVTVVCGIASAALATRHQPAEGLRDGRAVSRVVSRRLQRGLVAAEIGFAVVLLVGASLLSRSLAALVRSDSGVTRANVLTLKANLASNPTTGVAQQTALIGRMIDAVTQLPGVESVAATSSLPPNVSQMHTALSTNSRQASGLQDVSVEIVAASANLFSTLGVPLLRGRTVDASDTGDARKVLVLSDTAARRLFPDRDAVGQRLKVGPSDSRFGDPEIVGVVSDIKYSGLDAPPDGAVYMPYAQRPFGVMYVVIRTSVVPDSLVQTVRRALAAAEPSLAVSDVRAFDAVLSDAIAQPRFRTWLLVTLATLALLLAAVGLFGVIAHAVAERTGEIGIRMALGAKRSDILSLVMFEGVTLIGIGLCVGLVGSVALKRAVEALLYGVEALDPLSYVLALFFVVAIGLVASAIPAWRATRVDPLVACRAQ